MEFLSNEVPLCHGSSLPKYPYMKMFKCIDAVCTQFPPEDLLLWWCCLSVYIYLHSDLRHTWVYSFSLQKVCILVLSIYTSFISPSPLTWLSSSFGLRLFSFYVSPLKKLHPTLLHEKKLVVYLSIPLESSEGCGDLLFYTIAFSIKNTVFLLFSFLIFGQVGVHPPKISASRCTCEQSFPVPVV